jgi:hypothetical protein
MWAAAQLAILLAAAGTDPRHPDYLTGRWFGQGEPRDKTEMWLAQALPNGDFVAHFRACQKGQKGNRARDSLEKGKWWFQDGVEYVQITWVDGQVVFDETPYKILFHDGNHQTYSMPDGFVFRSSRVPPNFRMPECDLVS